MNYVRNDRTIFVFVLLDAFDLYADKNNRVFAAFLYYIQSSHAPDRFLAQ